MMKNIYKIIGCAYLFCFSFSVYAQHLELNSINTIGYYAASGSIVLKAPFSTGGNFRAYIKPAIDCDQFMITNASSNQNYILLFSPQKPITQAQLLVSQKTCEVRREINYFDGLGRPLQSIKIHGGASGSDIIQPFAFDELGRQPKTYQPYPKANNYGSYNSDALLPQAGVSVYYAQTAITEPGMTSTAYPFAATVYEKSGLSRVTEQGFPGSTWQPFASGIANSGHTNKLTYGTNADQVLQWTVNANGAIANGTYLPGTLSLVISKDENWTMGKVGTVEEFRDRNGKVILKRIWKEENTALNTYYIYDIYDNLRYVVPPAVTASSFNETDPSFLNYIYAYHYDYRKRIIEKKIPGKGWEFIIYNRMDRVVLTQNAVQAASGKWNFSKYDGLGRVILTGIYSNIGSRAAVQAQVVGDLWEKRQQNGVTDYTNNAFPNSGIDYYLTASYYDDYDYLNITTAYPPQGTVSNKTRGLLTASRVWNTSGTNPLWTVNYYDPEGRIIEVISVNQLGGTDMEKNTYNFAGEMMSSTRTHSGSASGANTIIANTYTYDHMGRKINTRHNINSQGEVYLNKLEYNELGQLVQKNLHNDLQSTSFLYNERNWMKNMTSSEFSMQLKYEDGTLPQYNGNITAQLWGNSLDKRFDYQYDKLNRLTNAITTGINMSETITYDVMGNITSLDRDATGANNYIYEGGNSNRLKSIATVTATDYQYDANGNAVTDGRNGMTLTYNHLNLPVTASGNNVAVTYTYNAEGQKLVKASTNTLTHITETTSYINGIQYKNSAIDFIQTEEGIARKTGGAYSYEYNLTDHLGNVRVSFKQSPIPPYALEILDRTDYYAFGKRKTGTPNANINKYLYNGKELQEELGEQYDYGARFYDPLIGRWNVIDAKSELYFNWSPYTYALNTPTNAVDPNGHLVIFINGNHYGGGGTRSYWQTPTKITERMVTGYDGQSWNVYDVTPGKDFAGAVMNRLNDHHDKYVDGAGAEMKGWHGLTTFLSPGFSGIGASDRMEDGYSKGKDAARAIIESLHRSGGVIDESIKIITHSMGGAYGKGYVQAILDYAKDKKIAGVTISFEADFAPFQPNQQKAVKGINTFQFSHSKDDFAGNDPMPGAIQMDTKSDKNQGHSIFGFFDQIQNLPVGKYKVVDGKIVPVN
jgi:RHS repeat-associated protein